MSDEKQLTPGGTPTSAMDAADSAAHSGVRNWKVGLTIVLVGIVLYGPSLNDGFHFDDELIVNDSNVTNSERWGHFLNPLYLRQVTFFTFYLNYQIGGENPFGYHIVNVAIHIGNAYLLYRLLALMAAGWIAPAAALIFLAHPIQTESVVYVYQRSTLLATFFALVALIVIAESDERRGFRVLGHPARFAVTGLCAGLWKNHNRSRQGPPRQARLLGPPWRPWKDTGVDEQTCRDPGRRPSRPRLWL